MSILITFAVSTLLLLSLALVAWRRSDIRSDEQAWTWLLQRQPSIPGKFDLSMISGLPEPAHRFFRFAITPGTPLRTVAVISMTGEFSLGTQTDPKYQPIRAEQILAAPDGFVWRVKIGRIMRISGSDGAHSQTSWSRFWLMGLLPVARVGGDRDHARAAFGRYIAEAVFWTPAALLPSDFVRWEYIDKNWARVIVACSDRVQAVDLNVAEDGSPVEVKFQRWSDANPAKEYQLQPFGGYLSKFQEFDGYRLPTRIEAGNFFGTDDYFPFFQACVSRIEFPVPPPYDNSL